MGLGLLAGGVCRFAHQNSQEIPRIVWVNDGSFDYFQLL
jgi:hypothetical protein